MTFELMDKSGNTVAAFKKLEEALAFVRENMREDDHWGLFQFSPYGDDDFIAAEQELRDYANEGTN